MNAKLALALALTTVCVMPFGAGVAAAPTPQAVAPEARSFMVGTIKVTALHNGGLSIPNDAKTFGVDAGAPAVAAVLAANGQLTDAIPVSINSLLVRTGGHIVVIDTGLGAKANSQLVASLALAGVAPADVTDVLITHSHGDHVGGLTDADGKPAFANAKVRMAVAEWTYMQGQPAAADLVKAITPQVATFTPGTTVVPGIASRALTGHTPGHVGYEVVSGRSRLLDIGDSAHSSIVSLADPDWTMGFDGDKAAGKASRRALLAELAKSHETVFTPHFPYPAIGTVGAKGTGYTWAPMTTASFTAN